jgi:hypothetical protein
MDIEEIGSISDRIGPIMDSAFLNLLSQEQVKTVALTIARGQLNVAVAQAKAFEDIVTTIESIDVQTKST